MDCISFLKNSIAIEWIVFNTSFWALLGPLVEVVDVGDPALHSNDSVICANGIPSELSQS